MLPTASNGNAVSKNTVLKSVEEKYLGLKDEINFDREKGLIFINPRLYTQGNSHQSASGILAKIAQKFDGIIRRYREWRAKEWFVGFVEKNFENNNGTRSLIQSVKASGRVPVSKVLEILVSKDYKISASESEVRADGSLRARYLIDGKDKIINKLIADDLKSNGFSDVAIHAFLNFFHFSDESWNSESFKDALIFLNQYSDKEQLPISVFEIPALKEKIKEMQVAASDFDAHQNQLARMRLRKTQDIQVSVTSSAQYSRADLSDFLEKSWGFSGIDSDLEDQSNSLPENSLKIAFLRYLKQGTKNMDAIFLENLRSFPRILELFPYIYDVPDSGEIKNTAIRKIFYQVVDELKQMRAQKKSNKIETVETYRDSLKILMQKITLNFRRSRNVLGVFLFPEMAKYIASFDSNLIDQKSKDSFVAASKVNVDAVAVCAKFSDFEKSIFVWFINKLKNDLSKIDSSLDF